MGHELLILNFVTTDEKRVCEGFDPMKDVGSKQ